VAEDPRYVADLKELKYRSETHSEGVNMTCFMVRQDDFKYIHVAGHDPQLYNVVDDPKEWHNLAGQVAYQEIEQNLHSLIMANFDPEWIEQDVQAAQARHWLLKDATQKTGLKWDCQPSFDATELYWREYG
jgi:choline-sulfatase